MKKRAVIFIILITVIMFVSSCSPAPIRDPEKVISVYCHWDELTPIVDKFMELHPDFGYTFKVQFTGISTTDYIHLDAMLGSGDEPDMFIVGSAGQDNVIQATQGILSGYAMPYEELGIADLGAKIGKADIFTYIVDIGTRPSDGKIVGLAYRSTCAAFIYRRSIAKEVWGTDNPVVIRTKIGPGWDKFFEAAEDLKAKGYYITADGDMQEGGDVYSRTIWCAVENSSDKRWISDGKLYIDPKREAYLDIAKGLVENGYLTSMSIADTAVNGERLFGFFGPAWRFNLIKEEDGWAACEPPAGFFEFGEWVLANKSLDNDPEKKAAVAEFIEWMTLDCTESGLQYYLAKGMIDFSSYTAGEKCTVASALVMAENECRDYLDGQNMFDIYIPAGELVNGANRTEYDYDIGVIWRKYAGEYARGECMREEAIAAFKREVKKQLGIDAW